MEKQVLKSQMSIFVSAAKLASMKRAYNVSFDKFTEGYHSFVESVKTRVDLFNNTLNSVDDVETIVSDYITQYNTITYKRTQNEDLRKEIDNCKMKIEANKKHIDNESLVLLTLKDIYQNIQNIAEKMNYEISEMNLVKDKIMFWKNTIAGEFISFKQKSNRLQTSLMNSSVGIVNRMDLTNSSLDLTAEQGAVFSSTKVDIDATMSVTMQRFGDISMLPAKRFTMPNYVKEVLTFNETPINCFYNITKEGLFYIYSNDSHRDDLKNAFSSALTHNGILYELRGMRKWSEDVNLLLKAPIPQIHHTLGNIFRFCLSSNIDVSICLVSVDHRKLKSNVNRQNERLSEIFDKMNNVSLKNMQILKSASKIFKFIESNPLRNYVPKTQKYKNVSYEEYENEFKMYYKFCN